MIADRVRMKRKKSISGYVIATDADFSGTADGDFVYIGSDEHVIIPHKIKGVTVTKTPYMFGRNASIVKGVATLEGHSITNMSDMFYDSSATTGYARTQADADRLNASDYKPEELIFIVKP